MSRSRGPGPPGSSWGRRGLLVVGKGLSRGSTNRYHSGKSGESLSAVFERNVQEAINNYSREMLSSVSSSRHATPTDLNNSWSGIKSCTTGLSTERSSVYSWRDDEFDKANTQGVHQLFWDIDEMLFEGKVTSQTQSLQAECSDWVERSLHLRVLGKQLLSPKNEGFQHFESRSDGSVDTDLPGLHERTSSIKELCVSGFKLIPKVSPVQKSPSSGSTMTHGSESSTYSFLQEEIYDADGKIEEYLAFDIKELDDECLEQKKIHLAEKRSKHGIPPVSPMACIRDAVASEIFDHIWSNVTGLLKELVKKHLETKVTGSAKQAEKLKAVKGKLPQSPAVHVTADVGNVLLSRGSEARSVSFGSHLASLQVHHFSSSFCSDLNGVMTVQAKPLQQRHFATVQKIQNDQEDKPHSISSSAPNCVHISLGRIADDHVLSSARVLPSSARKLPSHYRKRLPSINSEAVKKYPSVPRPQQSSYQGQYAHSRVSSAVPGTTQQLPLRGRTVTDQFSRPSTTHTFRTVAPQKRSLTPRNFSNHRGTSQGFLIGSQHYYKSFHRIPLASRRRFQIAS